MRSVPTALTWELFTRGRWNLLLAVFGANLLPILLLTALRRDGVIVSDNEPAFLIMHVVLLQIMMLTFGAAVFSSQGDVKRLFTYPIPTTTLVAWHMLPAMVLAWLQTVISVAAWNAIYGVDWPIWGPALFLAVAMISV